MINHPNNSLMVLCHEIKDDVGGFYIKVTDEDDNILLLTRNFIRLCIFLGVNKYIPIFVHAPGDIWQGDREGNNKLNKK